jgi:4-amino-4-deoxy-L-arabinose transferase-like glycosyltransferase
VYAAALVSGAVLSAFSAGYGYDRDELYFRLLRPRWGYIDQGPLTPLLARGMTNLFGDATWALRIPATLLAMVTTVVVALIARELGGGRGAQALAAWGFAFAALPVIFGHVLLTGTVDLPVWPAVLLFVIRAVRRADGRWWPAAGLVAGLSTYNKLLVAVLLLALLGGLLLTGPRRLLLSGWVLGAVAVLVVVALPNLIYQAGNSWPELSMGRALSQHNGGDVRVQMWPFLILLLGPPLVPIWIAGLVRLWRSRELRFIAAAFPVLLALVFVMGSQFYYPLGLLAVLFAAGCVPAAQWLATRPIWRRLMVIGLVVNTAVSLLLGLPLVPMTTVGSTPIAGINLIVQDSVGWPRYVRQIASVYDRLPARERARTIVFASNYGEAGAVDRYGRAYRLPAVYSGQNQLGYERRPPASATTAVVVGGEYPDARRLFTSCAVEVRLDNEVGVDNEEQGQPVAICRGPRGGWAAIWPRLRHLD